MAKHDWKTLRAEFAKSSLSLKDFAEQHGINYNTARRQLKASDQKSDHQSDQKTDHKGDHSSDTHQKQQKPALSDHPAPPEPETKPLKEAAEEPAKKGPGKGNRNRPTNAFEPENQVAVKHSGYARRLNNDEAIEDAKNTVIRDEIELCRARAMLCMDAHAKIKADMKEATSVEQRLELYNMLVSAEQAADRNIARVESLLRTEAQITKLKLESERLAAESAGLGTEIGDIVAEIQAMGSDGLMCGEFDD